MSVTWWFIDLALLALAFWLVAEGIEALRTEGEEQEDRTPVGTDSSHERAEPYARPWREGDGPIGFRP